MSNAPLSLGQCPFKFKMDSGFILLIFQLLYNCSLPICLFYEQLAISQQINPHLTLSNFIHLWELMCCHDMSLKCIAAFWTHPLLPHSTSHTRVWLPATREYLFGFNGSGHCLVRVGMLHYLRVGLRITITQSHTHTMQQTHMHKAVTRRVEAKKLLSRRRQLEYSLRSQII